jgi:hypothetical protein
VLGGGGFHTAFKATDAWHHDNSYTCGILSVLDQPMAAYSCPEKLLVRTRLWVNSMSSVLSSGVSKSNLSINIPFREAG